MLKDNIHGLKSVEASLIGDLLCIREKRARFIHYQVFRFVKGVEPLSGSNPLPSGRFLFK